MDISRLLGDYDESTKQEWQQLEKIAERLHSEALAAVALRENVRPVAEDDKIITRYNKTVSGYNMIFLRQHLLYAMILFLSRTWDNTPNALSIVHGCKKLQRQSTKDVAPVLAYRVVQNSDTRFVGDKPYRKLFEEMRQRQCQEAYDEAMERCQALLSKYKKMNKKHIHLSVKRFRHEYLAHSLEEADFVSSLRGQGREVNPIIYGEMNDLFNDTLTMIESFVYIVQRADINLQGYREMWAERAQAFWDPTGSQS